MEYSYFAIYVVGAKVPVGLFYHEYEAKKFQKRMLKKYQDDTSVIQVKIPIGFLGINPSVLGE